jgi:hypothetical protein
MLGQQASLLKAVAEANRIPVVVTNQVCKLPDCCHGLLASASVLNRTGRCNRLQMTFTLPILVAYHVLSSAVLYCTRLYCTALYDVVLLWPAGHCQDDWPSSTLLPAATAPQPSSPKHHGGQQQQYRGPSVGSSGYKMGTCSQCAACAGAQGQQQGDHCKCCGAAGLGCMCCSAAFTFKHRLPACRHSMHMHEWQ